MTAHTECYCTVCEQDEPLTRTVAFLYEDGSYSDTFQICESCFENKPDEVVEVQDEQDFYLKS